VSTAIFNHVIASPCLARCAVSRQIDAIHDFIVGERADTDVWLRMCRATS
jgi:hypothetical protein